MKFMKKEWFEEEDFWVNYAPVIFDENRWSEAPTVAQFVKDLAGLKKGQSVLDAGCGLGRISVELGLLDLKVTGVDIIQSELDAAKESADDEGVELELINCDLRNFNHKEKYDCVINLYTSFGYCDSPDDDMIILKNMCDAVKKGGTFIIECLSRETAILDFTPGEEFERQGIKVITDFSVVGAWEGLRSNWSLIFEDGKKIQHEFIQRLYPAAFLRDTIKSYGFSSVEVYGDFNKSPYNQNARTMVIVAKK